MQQHYSAIDYWTAGWIYPRERLREPFPRRFRKLAVSLIPRVITPGTGIGKMWVDAVQVNFSGAEIVQN